MRVMILLLYPLIADIRKSRFYIGPVLICTLVLGIGIVRGKITLFSVLTGWIPGMMMVMMSRWTNGKIGEGSTVVAAMGMLIGWYEILLLSQACFLSAGYGLWLMVIRKSGKNRLLFHSFFVYGCTAFFVFRAMKRKVLMRKVEGSMTVEASLLMPMVILFLQVYAIAFSLCMIIL